MKIPPAVSKHMAAIGSRGGKVKSEAKAKAARANGAKEKCRRLGIVVTPKP